jgi:hypothetical protein
MADKDSLIKNLDYLTETISSQVWILNLSVLATTWALSVTPTGSVVQSFAPNDALPIFGLCILSMICHLLQYFFGYVYASHLLKNIEDQGLETFQYNKKAILYRFRTWSFYVKITATLLGAGILVWKILVRILAI